MAKPPVISESRQPRRLPRWVFLVWAALVLALCGCAAMNVKLGWSVRLDKTPIQSMEVSVLKGPGISPGQKLQLVAKLTKPDGKVLVTEGTKELGKVMWKDLDVTTSVVV